MARDCNLPLSPEYTHLLGIRYGETIAARLANDWRSAPLTSDPADAIPYVRVGVPFTSPRPILYVPGFTEGIVAKAPFAAEMHNRGFDFILPGQNRRKLVKNALGKKDATAAQAENYLAVLDAEGLPDGQPVDVLPHSYGSLIFEAMLKMAPERFQGSRVIILAPGGSNEDETLPRLGGRFAKHMRSERKTRKYFGDNTGDMMKAGSKNMLANLPRSLREVRHLAHDRVDYEAMMQSGIASLMVLGYAEDVLFPHRVLEKTMQRTGVPYATPYRSFPTSKSSPAAPETLRGGTDASHNDEQFNSRRVGAAVAQLLGPADQFSQA